MEYRARKVNQGSCPKYHDNMGEGTRWSPTKCRCNAGPNGAKCDWCREKEREEAELLETEQALKNEKD